MESSGIKVSDTAISTLCAFHEMVMDENSRINLTRITDERDAAYLHFADSLMPLTFNLPIPGQARVLDIGSGAGFPAIPMAVLKPELHFTLLDSVDKKVRFIRGAIDAFALNAQAVHARAELLAHDKAHRESYSVVLSRAVAPLSTLLELALPFVKVGGLFLAWKGPNAAEELEPAANALRVLGGKLTKVYEYTLMDGFHQRCLIAFTKIRSTPVQYPRKPDLPRKNPIG